MYIEDYIYNYLCMHGSIIINIYSGKVTNIIGLIIITDTMVPIILATDPDTPRA